VGINGTPVIDWASQTLFVIAYVNGSPPTYKLFALNLSNLSVKSLGSGNPNPRTVAASHKNADGSILITFNAINQRQRAGLLFANGNVYAAFGSFCDYHATSSRGWLLGWNASTLTPLAANQLNDTQTISSPMFRLDSIWMSGAGIASDESGNLIFSTGNSDLSATTSTWDGVHFTNIQESVVKLSSDLKTILGLFSPNQTFGSFNPDTLQLDQNDGDLGSGGVVAIPRLSTSPTFFLAAMAGKDGRFFLFDRAGTLFNSLKFLQLENKGERCWCAPAYFVGPNGVGRVVTSQGSQLHTWHVNLATTPPSVSAEGTSAISSGQDPGFFTTVSCNGNGTFGSCASGTAIIWAVSRPLGGTAGTGVKLYAFSALVNSSLSYPVLFGPVHAGSWPNIGGNANIVPTVSNGKVYVASAFLDAQGHTHGQLTIFGLTTKTAPATLSASAQPIASLTSTFSISGILQDVKGTALTLKNRKGKDRQIDASQAMRNEQVAAALIKGDSFTVEGSSFSPTGALVADSIYRAKGDTGDTWPPDKEPNQ
jgi:hypothetical protein